MEIKALTDLFSVCKVEDATQIDLSKDFCFIAKTDEEISLVCPTKNVPAVTSARDDGWRGFRIQGTLDFSLISFRGTPQNLVCASARNSMASA